MTDHIKYVLDEARIPRRWYNLVADLPSPPPPVLHPGTLKPVGPDDLAPLFPMDLILQEVTPERYVACEEGTFNCNNGHFACTTCYVKMGMPSSPRGWVAP
jgi:predicted alternative tryptophan synthase beta-subunit